MISRPAWLKFRGELTNRWSEDLIAWVDEEDARGHRRKFYLLRPGTSLPTQREAHVDFVISRNLSVWLLFPMGKRLALPKERFWLSVAGKDRESIVSWIRLQFSGGWFVERWEGNVHYYDFARDSIKRWPNRDAFTVAEAWIYSEDKAHQLGIVVLVSGMDLTTKATTVEGAIREGGAMRDKLVEQHREAARSLAEDRVWLYSWRGEKIE